MAREATDADGPTASDAQRAAAGARDTASVGPKAHHAGTARSPVEAIPLAEAVTPKVPEAHVADAADAVSAARVAGNKPTFPLPTTPRPGSSAGSAKTSTPAPRP